MRYGLIIAGGSGTRLWPMSRAKLPKQLVPLIGGKSLLQIAMQRLDGLIPPDRRYICAGESHRQAILSSLPGFREDHYLGEPEGRDTLNAVGWGAVEISRRDPDAVIAVFTSDHVIEPVDVFQRAVGRGLALAEARPDTLVTFGIKPTHPATGYGYLQLGASIDEATRRVDRFKEKPDFDTAQSYVNAGPQRYLWNSGMFVWRASTLLRAIERFAPQNHAGLSRLAAADPRRRAEVLAHVYPTLKKISVDFAVMEPASHDSVFTVAAVPMSARWLDVGSWPALAETCPRDESGNALGTPRHLLVDTARTLVASSDPKHLIATLGCEGLIIVHTPDATLVCRADRAEDIKKLHTMLEERFGEELL